MRHHRSMLLQVWPRLVVENNLQRQQCCLIICDYFGWLQQIQNLRRAGLSNRSPTTEFLSKWNYLENWLINSCLDKDRREKETEKQTILHRDGWCVVGYIPIDIYVRLSEEKNIGKPENIAPSHRKVKLDIVFFGSQRGSSLQGNRSKKIVFTENKQK